MKELGPGFKEHLFGPMPQSFLVRSSDDGKCRNSQTGRAHGNQRNRLFVEIARHRARRQDAAKLILVQSPLGYLSGRGRVLNRRIGGRKWVIVFWPGQFRDVEGLIRVAM